MDKKKIIILIAILLLAAFLRLYRISDYMTFLGDEGRDVTIAKQILEGDLTLLGPRASAGDFFLGPAYYYMIAPFLWLFQYDPVGPAVMVAFFGLATVFMVYYTGKKLFNELTGFFAASLYSVSPLVITYSHSSWNPNVLPFFSLLIIYLIYMSTWRNDSWKILLLAGFLLGVALQLHYLALFLAAIVAVYTFIVSIVLDKKLRFVPLVKKYLQLFVGFIIGFSPFLLFEIRHGFPNLKTISGFIFSDTLQIGSDGGAPFLSIVGDVFFRVFGRLVFNFPTPDRHDLYPDQVLQFWGWAVLIASVISIVALHFDKNKIGRYLLYIWLFLGILLFGFYKKPIYDYYFTFLFPLPFLLIGYLLSRVYRTKNKSIIPKLLSGFLFVGLFIFNLSDMPFKNEPNRQKNQIKTISEFVISKTENKPYNFALITPGNSDHGYRYYFDILNKEPVIIENTILDPERKTVTKQLLIVCEQTDCKPLGHPLFEVAGFGRAEIAGEWDVSVVKVYKLVPFEEK